MNFVRYQIKSGVINYIASKKPFAILSGQSVLKTADTDILIEFDTVDHATQTIDKMDRAQVAQILADRDAAAQEAADLAELNGYISKTTQKAYSDQYMAGMAALPDHQAKAEIEYMFWSEHNAAKAYDEVYYYWLTRFVAEVQGDPIPPYSGTIDTSVEQAEDDYWAIVYPVWHAPRMLTIEPPA